MLNLLNGWFWTIKIASSHSLDIRRHFEQMKRFTILIITNSASDLSKLEFPEFRLISTKSEDFTKFLNDTEVPEFSFALEILESFQEDGKERYAIINKDLSQTFGHKKIYDVFNFLVLLFPSNLAVEHIVDFKFQNKKLIYQGSFKTDIFNEEDEGFVRFNEDKSDIINDFIKKYSKAYNDIGYLKSSTQNYMNAFDNHHYYHFSYIALCISLESITNGNTELLYRIKRNVAVICGKDTAKSQIIFDNINTIYKLRSKIVHGSDFSDEQVYKYLNYLQSIVSKTIIELLIHNITNLESLNKKITTLGFGDRDKISENWSEILLNDNIEKIIYEKI